MVVYVLCVWACVRALCMCVFLGVYTWLRRSIGVCICVCIVCARVRVVHFVRVL